MTRGLYIATTGMLNELKRQDVIANNLANVNTVGYKRDIPVSKSFPSLLLKRLNDPKPVAGGFEVDPRPITGRVGLGVNPDVTAHDLATPGGYQETGNVLDLALFGNGFFVIQTPSGERYTRNGNFVIDTESHLVTPDGYPVLGENGPIEVRRSSGSAINITEVGDVIVNNELVDQLQVVDFAKPYELAKMGNSMFIPTDPNAIPQQVPNIRVKSGTLEMSNVSVISEMVNLITVQCAYQANQRVIKFHDSAIGRAIENLGKVSI